MEMDLINKFTKYQIGSLLEPLIMRNIIIHPHPTPPSNEILLESLFNNRGTFLAK